MAFETERGRLTLGEWAQRKFKTTQSKRREALPALAELAHGEDDLGRYWGEQVTAQTRPLVRATDGLANKRLKAILTLMDLSAALGQEIAGVSRKLMRNVSVEKLEELIETRLHLTEHKAGIDTQVDSKRNALGVSERQDLRLLINDKYLQTRMKALAVKERLRARVQDRKFELERVDKAYSNTTASGA